MELSERDLLDIIEGQLPPERAEVVRRALESEPRLARKLAALSQDRKAVAASFARAAESAPAGLARGAVTLAEREGLLGNSTTGLRRVESTRNLPQMRFAAAVLVSTVAALIGGTWLVVSFMGAREDARLAVVPEEGGVMGLPPEDASPAANRSVELPQYLRTQEEHLKSLAAAPSAEALDQVERREMNESAVIEGGGVAEGAAQSERDAPATGWAALLRTDANGVEPLDAARLAMEGKLELVVPGVGPRTQAAAKKSQSDVAPSQRARKASRYVVELTVPADPSLMSVADALLELRGKLEAGLVPGSAWFRQVDTPTDEAAASATGIKADDSESNVGPPTPSTDSQHVFWWTRPPGAWVPYITIRVPVRIVNEDWTPPAP